MLHMVEAGNADSPARVVSIRSSSELSVQLHKEAKRFYKGVQDGASDHYVSPVIPASISRAD